jgi:hypothetical protein
LEGEGGTTHGSLRNHSALYWHQSVGQQVLGARSIHDPSEKGNSPPAYAHLVRKGAELNTKRDTHEYVASSSYAVECPIPFNDPAVASERCVSKPLSERPTFITRRSNTRRFDKKSDEL